MQYFSKKKLVLPEGYFVNSSQIPLAKEVNKLLANCGCETFPTKPLAEAIKKGAAIETNPSVDELVESLKILFKMNHEKRNKMSDLAYSYILENHCWSKLTSEIQNLYYSICKDI